MPVDRQTRAIASVDNRLHVLDRSVLPVAERTDEALMLDHAAGDEAAFEELVRRHQRGVLNFTYRMLRNRAVAEEVTQEVFLALVKNARRYQPTAKFTTYLYTIASNLVSKEWLRRKRRPIFFSLSGWGKARDEENMAPVDKMHDETACVVAQYERGEVNEAVNDALMLLPDHQREAFVLRRLQDMPYEDIARVTNVPVGTAKSRVVRAERALRPLLTRFKEYLR